jgi:hypothetical protein
MLFKLSAELFLHYPFGTFASLLFGWMIRRAFTLCNLKNAYAASIAGANAYCLPDGQSGTGLRHPRGLKPAVGFWGVASMLIDAPFHRFHVRSVSDVGGARRGALLCSNRHQTARRCVRRGGRCRCRLPRPSRAGGRRCVRTRRRRHPWGRGRRPARRPSRSASPGARRGRPPG